MLKKLRAWCYKPVVYKTAIAIVLTMAATMYIGSCITGVPISNNGIYLAIPPIR